MRAALLLLAILALTPLAAAGPLPISSGACTPYFAFIDPNPLHECASVYFGNVNDFCVAAGPASKCVHFIGPDVLLP